MERRASDPCDLAITAEKSDVEALDDVHPALSRRRWLSSKGSEDPDDTSGNGRSRRA